MSVSSRSPWAKMVVFVSIILGISCLQALLTFLWPERESTGLLMLIAGELAEASNVPHKRPMLGYWEISTWLLILGVILFARLIEARPGLILGFRVQANSTKEILTSFIRLALVYAIVGLLAAAFEHLFTFHFTTTIAHYLALATLVAGVLFAGRRWPFRHLEFSAPTDDASRVQRRRWDLALAILLGLLYWQWMGYERLSRFEYELSIGQTALMQSINFPFGILLGLGILKGSLPVLMNTVLNKFETHAPPSELSRLPGLRTAGLTWLTHLTTVAGLLIGARLLWSWSHRLWLDGRWLVPPEEPQRLLGVDWYWATVWEGVTAAEVFVLAAWIALTSTALLPRNERKSKPQSAAR